MIEIVFTNKYFLIIGFIVAAAISLAILKKLFKVSLYLFLILIILFFTFGFFYKDQMSSIKNNVNKKIERSSNELKKSLPDFEEKIKKGVSDKLKDKK